MQHDNGERRRSSTLPAVLAVTGISTAGAASASTAAKPAHVKTEQVCGAPTAHRLTCYAVRQVSPAEPAAIRAAATRSDAVTPNATPSGYGPSDLRSAYKLTASGSGTVAMAGGSVTTR